MFAESSAVESDGKAQLSRGAVDNSSNQDDVINGGSTHNRALDLSGIDGPQSVGMFKSSTLIAHRDCITGLAIGGKNLTLLRDYNLNHMLFYWVCFFCSMFCNAQQLPVIMLLLQVDSCLALLMTKLLMCGHCRYEPITILS